MTDTATRRLYDRLAGKHDSGWAYTGKRKLALSACLETLAVRLNRAANDALAVSLGLAQCYWAREDDAAQRARRLHPFSF